MLALTNPHFCEVYAFAPLLGVLVPLGVIPVPPCPFRARVGIAELHLFVCVTSGHIRDQCVHSQTDPHVREVVATRHLVQGVCVVRVLPFPSLPFWAGGYGFHSLCAWLSYFDHMSWSGRQPAANHHLGDGLLVHNPFQGVWVLWVLPHTSLTHFG